MEARKFMFKSICYPGINEMIAILSGITAIIVLSILSIILIVNIVEQEKKKNGRN